MNNFVALSRDSSCKIPSIDTPSYNLTTSGGANVYVIGEYFSSHSEPTAKSNIDYLESPIEQIQNVLNQWFEELGNTVRMKCDESFISMAPVKRIPSKYFNTYKPFFHTIYLYQARLGLPDPENSEPPSDSQMNAAYLGLANLMAALAPAPTPMLLEDGTIGGYWRRGSIYASIDFEVDGEHTWVGSDGQNFNSGTWKLPGQPLPAALAKDLLALVE
ncbi:hypothetical protein [Delftia acidovorans]|uniref:hypothetical protein n=1 Tax=Delftia acidovorans TaxID=80866 RepID=UPI002FDE8602